MLIVEFLLAGIFAFLAFVLLRPAPATLPLQIEAQRKISVGLLLALGFVIVDLVAKMVIVPETAAATRAPAVIAIKSTLLAGSALLIAFGSVELWRVWRRLQRAYRDDTERAELWRSLSHLAAETSSPRRFLAALNSIASRYLHTTGTGLLQCNSEHSCEIIGDDAARVLPESFDPARYLPSLRAGNVVLLPTDAISYAPSIALLPLRPESAGYAAVLFIWHEETYLVEPIRRKLRAINSVLSLLSLSDKPTIRREMLRRAKFSELQDDLQAVERIDDGIRLIYNTLSYVAEFDILRLAVYDSRGGNITQYCLGRGGSLLSEREREVNIEPTELTSMYTDPRVALTNDLASSRYIDHQFLARCGARQALSIPLQAEGAVQATITLASSEGTLSESLGTQLQANLKRALLPLIRADRDSRQLADYNRRLLNLAAAVKVVAGADDVSSVPSRLATLAVRTMPVAICRIWRYDRPTGELTSLAVATSRELPQSSVGSLLLTQNQHSVMKRVIESQRLAIAHSEDPDFSERRGEMEQVLFEGVQAAMLLPIIHDGNLLGILAVGDQRNHSRRHFTLTDTVFVQALADICAQALELQRAIGRAHRYLGNAQPVEDDCVSADAISAVPTRMATPLTSILARCDLLLTSREHLDGETSKQIDSIRRSAVRMFDEVRRMQTARRRTRELTP